MKVYSPSEYVGDDAVPGILITTEAGENIAYFPPTQTHIEAIFREDFGIPPIDQETNIQAPSVNRYKYANKTVLILEDNVKRVEIELQSITNKPTWSLGTQEAMEVALKEILQ